MYKRSVIHPSEEPLQITDLPLRSPAVWTAVALGGGTGALLRFFWSIIIPFTQTGFPWTVFLENITGAFALGWLLAIFTSRHGKHRYIRAFFGTGLVGSFTTFSGITADLADYSSSGAVAILILYPTISIAAGLAAAWAGWSAGHTTKQLYYRFCKP